MKEREKAQNSKVPIRQTKPECNKKIGFLRSIRKNIGAFSENFWELSASIRLYKVDAAIIVGKEKHTELPFKTFYIGHYDNFAFILNEIYSQFEVKEKHTNINSLHTNTWLEKYRNSVDLLFTDVELLFCKILPRREFIQIPQWIRQKFDVPNTWEEVLNRFRKNTKKTDLRKVRKYNFTYKITKSEEEFKTFYHSMYKPYLKKRFGDAVLIEPEWKVLRQCRKGELMQVIRGKDVVACVLLHNLAGRLAYVWVGVPDDIEAEMFNGAFSALYYFTILYGYENGCHEIDFLGTRPLLNDGLFRYKRKWGTYVEDSPLPRGDILLKPLRFNLPIRSLFAHNYFLTRDGKGLAGKIFFDKHKMTVKELEGIVEYYFTEGLQCIKIFSLHGFDDDAKVWEQTKASQVKLFDLSESSNPAETFCRL